MSKKIAVYPGSFDPITNGHIDIIKRGIQLFDWVDIAVIKNPAKKPVFSLSERVRMVKNATKSLKKVSVSSFEGLLVNYVKFKHASIIIRGLRAVSDFEYEFQMALMNRRLSSRVETVFLMPQERYTYLSSSIIKEIVFLGGDVKGLVPDEVEKALKKNLLTK